MRKDIDLDNLKTKIETIREKGKITQITASRIVKVPRNGGDVFLSMVSNYDEGLSAEEARIASNLLSLEVNVLAFRQACASGIISVDEMNKAVSGTKANYKHLLLAGEK